MITEQSDQPAIDEPNCANPCHPDAGCPHCEAYWDQMVASGWWDRERGQWTDKGWHEIVMASARY